MSVRYDGMIDLSRRLEAAGRLAPKLVDDFLQEKVAKPLTEELRATAPVDEGHLRDSFRWVKNGALKYTIGSYGITYAKFVSEGTRPHEIKPKKSSVLAFKIGNRTVFASSVHHPGTKANPYFTDAVDKITKRALPQILGVALGSIREKK